jgi:hypothetical protein
MEFTLAQIWQGLPLDSFGRRRAWWRTIDEKMLVPVILVLLLVQINHAARRISEWTPLLSSSRNLAELGHTRSGDSIRVFSPEENLSL